MQEHSQHEQAKQFERRTGGRFFSEPTEQAEPSRVDWDMPHKDKDKRRLRRERKGHHNG